MALHRITRIEIENWFDAYSLTAPGRGQQGAEDAAPDFELCDRLRLHRGEPGPVRETEPAPQAHPLPFARGNPPLCIGSLDGYADERTGRQADIIRLLLLTGCRKGEIVGLRWRDFDGDILNLVDSKTGPRKVLLNAAARRILESQPRMESPYVFPSPSNPARPRSDNLPLWYRVKATSRHRRCTAARFAPHLCQSGGAARRSAAGRREASRPQAGSDDAAVRACRRPRGRSGPPSG